MPFTLKAKGLRGKTRKEMKDLTIYDLLKERGHYRPI